MKTLFLAVEKNLTLYFGQWTGTVDTLRILLLFWRSSSRLSIYDRECCPVSILLPGTGLPLPDGAGLGRGEGRRDEDTEFVTP